MGAKTKFPWQVLIAALFVFCFACIFSFFVFRHIPHIHDEIAYVFQAKIFALGRVSVSSPCAKEAFDFTHVINNGKWYSQYPPGYPLLLLLGLLGRAPWLINPLLAALAIILIYGIARDLYDRTTGILASVLGAASLWFLIMSSTMMSHTSSLFFSCLFVFFLFRSLRNPSFGNGLGAGLGLGMAFLIRPYNAALFSLPFLLLYGFNFIKDRKRLVKNVLAFCLFCLIFVSLFLLYNQVTNGSPFRTGYIISYGKSYAKVFGRAAYLDYDYTPLFAAVQMMQNLKALNSDVFGWPLTSFWALFALTALVWRNPSTRKKDLFLFLSIFPPMAGYFLFWGSVLTVGARMLFETMLVFLVLSSRGILELSRFLSAKILKAPLKKIHFLLAGVLILFVGYAFLVRLPRWAWPHETEWYHERFDRKFAAVTPDINATLKTLPLEKPAVIILKLVYQPSKYFPTGMWGSGFLYNDPLLKNPIIYASDQGAKNIELLRCYPDHKFYLYLGTLEKGLVVPLKIEVDTILFGKPFAPDKNKGLPFEVIDTPQKLYTIYSAEFRNFLKALYMDHNFAEVDVPFLISEGKVSLDAGKYQEASFFFEAALQLEKDPAVRYSVLGHLFRCYLKTGQSAEAKILLPVLADTDNPRLYHLIPERGF